MYDVYLPLSKVDPSRRLSVRRRWVDKSRFRRRWSRLSCSSERISTLLGEIFFIRDANAGIDVYPAPGNGGEEGKNCRCGGGDGKLRRRL
jgi:hypothetical protein